MRKRKQRDLHYLYLHPLVVTLGMLKGKYYPVVIYDDLYTRWTTLYQERDQTVSEFTNVFPNLRTKLGIKFTE
jgi:hypothetical protein